MTWLQPRQVFLVSPVVYPGCQFACVFTLQSLAAFQILRTEHNVGIILKTMDFRVEQYLFLTRVLFGCWPSRPLTVFAVYWHGVLLLIPVMGAVRWWGSQVMEAVWWWRQSGDGMHGKCCYVYLMVVHTSLQMFSYEAGALAYNRLQVSYSLLWLKTSIQTVRIELYSVLKS